MCARRRRRRTGGPHGEHLPWDRVHPTLDLHGETADRARELAGRWLREQRRDGIRTVRIVTGRGLHSVGPPVLPGVVSDVLRELRGTVVATAEREPGGGSFLVELRRPDPRGTGRSAAPSTPSAPPDTDLRRRAEESLAELGITPTRELIAAEVRRLRLRQGGESEP